MKNNEMEYDETNSIRIVNERSVELEFIFEPWGSAAPMQPGETFFVVFETALQGKFEIYIEEDRISFCANGLPARVFKDGKDLKL